MRKKNICMFCNKDNTQCFQVWRACDLLLYDCALVYQPVARPQHYHTTEGVTLPLPLSVSMPAVLEQGTARVARQQFLLNKSCHLQKFLECRHLVIHLAQCSIKSSYLHTACISAFLNFFNSRGNLKIVRRSQ